VVNVIGTSTCIIAMSRELDLVPGVCGVVPGSVHPEFTGIEAGLSAVGDIFDAIARRAGVSVKTLAEGLAGYTAGQTGLLRLSWDNGDRTVLVNPDLGGITLGWKLMHTTQDEFFAAIEGTAFHTRIVLERMTEHRVPVERVIHGGGIPQNNDVLNQVYANVLGKPVLVPDAAPTGLGAAIFAFVAVGVFPTIEAAQQKLCASFRRFDPEPDAVERYERLYQLYRKVYFALGERSAAAVPLGDVLPELSEIAQEARELRAQAEA
jgi:L-ribulokinase